MTVMCPCGRPLHYSDPRIEKLVQAEIDRLGETVTMKFLSGLHVRVFKVPRHWIALHGANLDDVVRMKFEEVKK